MDKDDKKIEEFLKSRIDAVSPSRASFDAVLKSVTDGKSIRNIKGSEHYKLTSFSMSKFVKIGLPVALIAIVAVVAVGKPKTDVFVVNDTTPSSNVEQSATKTSPEITITKDSSGDEILASFFADAEADAMVASAESEDETYMNSQVDAFNSFNQTRYENNI